MRLQRYWYQHNWHPLVIILLPLGLIFRFLVFFRKCCYRFGIKKTEKLPIPTIVVGNITTGGTGKTPFIIWLVEYLKKQGKNPGIALRGVGGRKNRQPVEVAFQSDPSKVGDEAVLLSQNTFCPVVSCIDRVAAIKKLIDLDCNIAICDDGLQHYRLGRDIEIAIIDGSRYFGNSLLLPAGPLREPISRLNEVDLIVINQSTHLPDSHNRLNQLATYPMHLEMEAFVSIYSHNQQLNLSAFSGQTVHAIAGIGNPYRFFAMLGSLSINFIPHIFSDHHHYEVSDLEFNDTLPIIMTEKDAVKCRLLMPNDKQDQKQLWYLRVRTEVNDGLKQAIQRKISSTVIQRLTGLKTRHLVVKPTEETP